MLKGPQFRFLCAFYRDGADFVKLSFQFVQKQRVNDLVDIFNAGIVHTAAAAGFGVQGAFKDGTENCGAYLCPIEIFACFYKQQLPDLVGKRWYLNIFVREQPAVNIRECSQIRVVIL